MNIKIIPMSSEWYQQASQMIQKTIRISQKSVYSPELIEKFCPNYDVEKLKIKAQEVDFFIAIDAATNKLVGTIGLKDNQLKTFFVGPDYQGKGIGRHLYDNLERVAHERRIKKIILFSSPLGVPIYLKFGFKKIKTVTDNLDGIEFEDTYMEKELE